MFLSQGLKYILRQLYLSLFFGQSKWNWIKTTYRKLYVNNYSALWTLSQPTALTTFYPARLKFDIRQRHYVTNAIAPVKPHPRWILACQHYSHIWSTVTASSLHRCHLTSCTAWTSMLHMYVYSIPGIGVVAYFIFSIDYSYSSRDTS